MSFLNNGAVVEKAMETKAGVNRGDYIVSTNDLKEYGSDYYFEAKALGTSQKLQTEQLQIPKVAVTGTSQLTYTFKRAWI